MLEAGELVNAGLDVFEHAPAVNEKLIALAKMGKVTLLPHMGSATHEGRADMGEKVIVNIRTFVDGHRPPDQVLPSMLRGQPLHCRRAQRSLLSYGRGLGRGASPPRSRPFSLRSATAPPACSRPPPAGREGVDGWDLGDDQPR